MVFAWIFCLKAKSELTNSSLECYSYTYLFEREMMINSENKNVLKGQYNLAQGKRSGALGLRTGIKIVRAITFIKAKI